MAGRGPGGRAGLSAQPLDPSLYADLRWRLIGPFRGGWATVAEGVPDEPGTYYFGAAAGGVWKTEDAGRTWTPIFDRAGSASVGAIAIAPSNPKVIYVGTGQIQARYDIASGDGVYRSDDGGASWRQRRPRRTRARSAASSSTRRNPNVALVAALGHIFGPNRERGVFRTEDGGGTWSQVLFVDENTGGADLAADPENPAIVYAASGRPATTRGSPTSSRWSVRAAALYKSSDGGRTWKRALRRRLAGGQTSGGSVSPPRRAAASGRSSTRRSRARRAVELARASSARTTRGATWTRVNATPGLGSSYMNRLTADPRDRDVGLRDGAVDPALARTEARRCEFFRGRAGRRRLPLPLDQPEAARSTWSRPPTRARSSRSTAGSPGATGTTSRPASSTTSKPTTGFPYWIYSGQQDSGTVGAASRSDYGISDVPRLASRRRRGARLGRAGSARSGHRLRHGPRRNDHALRRAHGTGAQRLARRRRAPTGGGPCRGVPLGLGLSARHVAPAAARALRRLAVSAALARRRRELGEGEPGPFGRGRRGRRAARATVTLENARPCGFGVIFTIELSPRDAHEIWVGTDDGLIQRTRDGGKTWKNVTPKGLPAWSKVSTLDVSPLEPGVVYAAVDAHRRDDFTPHLYRTRDSGESWQEISTGLPRPGFTMVVRADPVRRGLLYAGTDTGVFVSFDDGDRWQPLQLNLPTCWVGGPQGPRRRSRHRHAGPGPVGARRRDAAAPARRRRPPRRRRTLFAPAPAVRVRAQPEPGHAAAARDADRAEPPGGRRDRLCPRRRRRRRPCGSRSSTRRARPCARSRATIRRRRSHARRYFTDLYVHPPAPPSAAAGHHRFVWDLRYPRPKAERYDYMISAVAGEDTPDRAAGPARAAGPLHGALDGRRQALGAAASADDGSARRDGARRRSRRSLRSRVRLVAAMGESFAALERVRALRKELAARAKRLETALAAVNEMLGTTLTSLDGADAAPTSIQAEAYARARADLDRLLAELK